MLALFLAVVLRFVQTRIFGFWSGRGRRDPIGGRFVAYVRGQRRQFSEATAAKIRALLTGNSPPQAAPL